MVDERYPVSDARCGVALLAGEDQHLLFLHEPELLEQVRILIGDLGSLPLGQPQVFRRHGGSVLGEL